MLWLAKHGPCQNCGSSVALEVDHIDPSQKLSHRIWAWSDERREAELAKCQVLCRRCHKDKTKRNQGAGEYAPHGPSRYQWGCRCAICQQGNRLRKARQRAVAQSTNRAEA